MATNRATTTTTTSRYSSSSDYSFYSLLPPLTSSTSTLAPPCDINDNDCLNNNNYYTDEWPVSTTTVPSITRLAGPLRAITAARLAALEARWFTTAALSSTTTSSWRHANRQVIDELLPTPTMALIEAGSASIGSDDDAALINNNGNFAPPEQGPAFVAVIVTLYVLEFIIGIVGNLAVIVVIARQTNMHNVTNFFIANMAVADILLAALSLPITPHFTLTGEWIFGRVLCHLLPFVQGTAFFACTLTLMNIAIDRWRNVCHPLTPRMTHSACAFYICLTWLFSALVCLPYGVLMKIEANGTCAENWPTDAVIRSAFGTAVLMLQYFIPLLVISVCYILIWARLKQRPRFTSASGERERRELQRQNRLQTMLSLMVVFFAISWLPMNAVNLIFDFFSPSRSWTISNALFLVCHLIAMSSVCYNPILYAGLNETFRAGLWHLLGFAPTSPNTSLGGGGGGGGGELVPINPQTEHISRRRLTATLPNSQFRANEANQNTLIVDGASTALQKNGTVPSSLSTSATVRSNLLEIQPTTALAMTRARLKPNSGEKLLDSKTVVVEISSSAVRKPPPHEAKKTKKSKSIPTMSKKKQHKQRELTTTTTLLSWSPVDSPIPSVGDRSATVRQIKSSNTVPERIRLLPLSISSNGSSSGGGGASGVRSYISTTDTSGGEVVVVAPVAAAIKQPKVNESLLIIPTAPDTVKNNPLRHQNSLSPGSLLKKSNDESVYLLTSSASHPTNLSHQSSFSTASASQRNKNNTAYDIQRKASAL